MTRNRNAKAKVNRPRQNGRKAQSGNARRSGASIPAFRSNVIVNHRFRYLASANLTGFAITDSMVLGAMGTMGTGTNTTVTHLFKTFRLKSIEIWSPTSTSTTAATCAIDWIGNNVNSPNMETSDTSINVSMPAHVRVSPPADARARWWQSSTSTTMFNITCPSGSIVDLSVEGILADQTSAGVTVAVATAVIGVQYWLALDGVATHGLAPVSLSTTF